MPGPTPSILLEIARRLGAEKHFTYNSSEEIFNELRVASKGGTADYFGITYKKIEDNMGVFWPCPSEDHPGTPRLWEDRKFKTPDGRAHFHGVPYRDPGELTDAEYPMILTTGRVVSQYLSGTQTRRIGKLVDQYPEPLLEIHPKRAAQYGIKDRELVRVFRPGAARPSFPRNSSRRSAKTPCLFPIIGRAGNPSNQLTSGHLDPVSKIPEFKVCACKLEPLGRPAPSAAETKAYASA